jgi:hypothetical protein
MARFVVDCPRFLRLGALALLMGILITAASSVTGVSPEEATVYSVLFLDCMPGALATAYMSVVPLLIFASVTAGMFAEDLNIAELFVFPRMRSGLKWYALRQTALLLQVFLYTFIYLATVFSGFAVKYGRSPFETPGLAATAFLSAFFYCGGIMAVNALAIKITPKWAMVVFVAVMSAGVAFAVREPSAVFARLNPAYHFFSHWRVVSVTSSLAFNAVLVCASFFAGAIFITKKQIRGI